MAYYNHNSDRRPNEDDDLEADYCCYGNNVAVDGGGMNIAINGQPVGLLYGFSNGGQARNIYISGDSNSEIIINGQRIVPNTYRPSSSSSNYCQREPYVDEIPPAPFPVQCEDDTSSLYESVSQRLQTFDGFPSNVPVSPSELARAGFFYTGVADMVQCFICNGKVRDWELGDSAFGEHMKFFPQCEFVRSQMDA